MDNASKVKAMTAAKAGVEAGGEGRREGPEQKLVKSIKGWCTGELPKAWRTAGLASRAPSTIGLLWRAFTGPRTAVARATPTPSSLTGGAASRGRGHAPLERAQDPKARGRVLPCGLSSAGGGASALWARPLLRSCRHAHPQPCVR